MLGGALVFSRGSKSERHLRKKINPAVTHSAVADPANSRHLKKSLEARHLPGELIGYWLLAGSRGPCWFSWFFSAFFAFRRGHKTQDSQRTTVAHQNDSTKPKHDADAACGTWHVARGTWHVWHPKPKAPCKAQSRKPKACCLFALAAARSTKLAS